MDTFLPTYKILTLKMLADVNRDRAGPEGFEPPTYGLRVRFEIKKRWVTAFRLRIYPISRVGPTGFEPVTTAL